ncbi:MAG TPA: hypothetical protein VFF53_12220 [Geobacteraceae bacterium]|nr:hypothetical protein [Geobacteraceae bacterium]
MNHVSRVNIASLLVVLVMLGACKAKQEKPAESTVAPEQKSATAPATSPAPGKPDVRVASPQDMADARAGARRVLEQMAAGDFTAIYRDSAPSFKQIGSEAAFVTKFQQTRQKTGVLKNPKELKFDTRPDNVHVLVYRVDNERFTTEMRLSFERAKSGAMELVGLNQHDELKK